MRRGQITSRRSGNVLVYFALIVFVMFTMAALTIDMGFARLTQRQMQPAVEAAALTGLRFRDQIPDWMLANSTFINAAEADCGPKPSTTQTLTDPTWVAWREKVRRWLASNQVALVFDDDLNPAAGDSLQLGAGPLFQMTTGTGQANAWQTITPPDQLPVNQRVYKPVRHDLVPGLELNFANVASGDLVAGQFSTPSTAPQEDSSYTRSDFTPASQASASTANSFLVRMRRTNDFQNLDNVASQSSSGPSLQFLFGRGSLITSDATNNPNNYSPRQHGVTVRATAIANAQNAMSVGPIYPPGLILGLTSPIDGVTPFAMEQTFWESNLTLNTPFSARVRGSGMGGAGNGQILPPMSQGNTQIGQVIRVTTLAADVTNSNATSLPVTVATAFPTSGTFRIRIDNEIMNVIGGAGTTTWSVIRGIDKTTATTHTNGAIVTQMDVMTIGQPILNGPEAGLRLSAANPSISGFVPLYRSISGVNRVIGFGQGQMTFVSARSGGGGGINVQITKLPGFIVPVNASGTLAKPLDSSLSSTDATTLFSIYQTFLDPLQAPVLAR